MRLNILLKIQHMKIKTYTILFLLALCPILYAQGKNADIKSREEYQKEIEELNDKIDDLNDKYSKLEKITDKLKALHISGYFDVSISNYKNKPNVFALGDFGVEIEHSYKENFQVGAALVFNEGAELHTGFIDYHLFGSPISLRGRLFVDEGLHLQVGKFDVPFGNDWQYYTAIDRMAVTPPLTTEMVMEGGYNDEGIRLLFNSIWLNLTLYMLDGIEQKYSYGGNSYGGRIGFTPFSNPFMLKAKSVPIFELGCSFIYDVDANGEMSEKLYAFDVESKITALLLRAEYIRREKEAGVLFDGYHVTGGLDFNHFSSLPVILYSRYDFFRTKNYIPETYLDILTQELDKLNVLSRFSVGLNINIYGISYLKLEYQRFLKTYEEYRDQYFSKSLYYAQLVISF